MTTIYEGHPINQQDRSFAVEQMAELNGEIARGVHMPETERQIVVGAVALEGSVLFEGSPSTGKTRAATVVAAAIGGELGRVQGNPDVMPSDITGTRYYDMKTGDWKFMEGPVFSNVFFADELNRMPTKSQAALLEAMQERQVTIPGETDSRKLPSPFIVLATQNPSENSQGTNPLTVAQLDRFNVGVHMRDLEEEDILAIGAVEDYSPSQVVDVHDVSKIKKAVESVAVPEKANLRAIRLAVGLRQLGVVDSERSALSGRRASRQTVRYAKALAMQHGDRVVSPEHVDLVAPFALGHRTVFTYEGLDGGYTPDRAIEEVKSSL